MINYCLAHWCCRISRNFLRFLEGCLHGETYAKKLGSNLVLVDSLQKKGNAYVICECNLKPYVQRSSAYSLSPVLACSGGAISKASWGFQCRRLCSLLRLQQLQQTLMNLCVSTHMRNAAFIHRRGISVHIRLVWLRSDIAECFVF